MLDNNTLLKLRVTMTQSICDTHGKEHIITKAREGDLAVTVPKFKYRAKFDKLCKVVPDINDINDFLAVEWVTPGVQAEPGFYHKGWFTVEKSKGNA